MRVLVTGANGYMGEGIVHKLLEDGNEVVSVDLSFDRKIGQGECQLVADLFSVQDPYNEFGCPDVLLHLAWRNGFVHNDMSHIDDLPKHVHFIKKMAESGVGRIAVLGTMHEVGFFEGSIKEDTPTNPLSFYGVAKDALRRASQLLCESYNVPLQWIRGFYIVGNTRRGSSIFSKISFAEANGQEVFPFTSGENQWDFIDYDVFCEQISAIVEQSETTGIINACSGKPEKLSTVVEDFIRRNNYSIRLAYGQFPDRPYDSKAVWGDDAKIRAIMSKRKDAVNA